MKGLKRSLDRGNPLEQHIIKRTIQMDALSVPIAIGSSPQNGHGTVVLDSFRKGNVLFLGARIDVSFTAGDVEIDVDFDSEFGLGTAPSVDETSPIAGVQQDLILRTIMPQAIDGTTVNKRAMHAKAESGEVFDNTDSSIDMNLNIIIPDADISVNPSSVLVTGNVTVAYLLLGDDDLP